MRTTWAGAEALMGAEIVAPGAFEDEDGQLNDYVAILMGSDETLVIEDTIPNLREGLRALLRLLDRYEDTH